MLAEIIIVLFYLNKNQAVQNCQCALLKSITASECEPLDSEL
jgi:hypothetical protein